MTNELVIALVGNPNCGKTSTFNELTGSKQHVGNWPGVTVEKKIGKLKFEGRNVTVVDLPGIYSLGAYSEDEVVACNYILKDKPDVVVNIIDATNIERNLYLTMQLLETGAKVILALNMMDEANSKNIRIDTMNLSKLLDLPVIEIIATKGRGIKDIIKEALKINESGKASSYKIQYGKDIEKEVQILKKAIYKAATNLGYPTEWAAIKLLENDAYVNKGLQQRDDYKKISSSLEKSIERLTAVIGYEPDAFLIDKRYEAISGFINKCVKREEVRTESTSDKIDKIITNKWLGIPIFAAIMFFMYQFSITFGNEFLGGMLDQGFGAVGEWLATTLSSIGASELLTSFLTDGIIGGVGAVLVFFPMILTMYFLIALLEDSGYMARAAYVMDRLMNAVGLHGKTAVSLIIGGGCNVAGIMSTRTLESKKDRMIAILINPFVSCPARLAVYGVFVGAFFADKKLGVFNLGGIIIFLLYVLGIVVAILLGKFLSDKVFKGEESYFVMELPPYRIPTAKGLLIHMWEKSESFLKKAGTVILTVVIVVWVLSNLPLGVQAGSVDSILGVIGSFIAPVFTLAGFGNWQSAVALITGFAAKEAVVGTLGTIYGVTGEGASLTAAIQQAFTPLSALSFMIMTLLYVPCVATIVAVRKETNSKKWAWIVVAYTTIIGWILAVLVYQVGKLLGFN
ncbi:ferrous iron transport protein B [Clostridium sp. FP1]|uniref:ferrous iron transport protein B n=1 Tax=Clostridium sp. FP1 TaxID=2724076 RepID=UPI0013E932FB|nr:ferrous iron transport protein B [Clostridium sp. FP1]MBZ9634465.1 ferrous iron transport protein B [Clostridium sp. FP1]